MTKLRCHLPATLVQPVSSQALLGPEDAVTPGVGRGWGWGAEVTPLLQRHPSFVP